MQTDSVTIPRQDSMPSWSQLLRDRVKKFQAPSVILFLPLNSRTEHYHHCSECGQTNACNMNCKLHGETSHDVPEILVDGHYVCFDCEESVPPMNVQYWNRYFGINTSETKGNTMSEKPLTHKQLIKKASSKISATAFLDSYAAHVRETYPEAIEVLDMVSSGTLLPTPALDAIKQIVQAHVVLGLQKKNQSVIEKFESNQDKPKRVASGTVGSGRYTIQFFVKVTNERTEVSSIELYTDKDGHNTFKAMMYQDAERLVDRRQNEMMNAVYAVISSDENGKALPIVIPRADSVARANKRGKGPSVRNAGTGMSKPLTSYMSVHNDTCSFSRG